MVRLADEAVRVGGEDRAVLILHEWCLGMATSAVRLRTAQVLKRKDSAENAVKWVLAHRRDVVPEVNADGSTWQPMDLSEMKLPQRARTLYEGLVQYVSVKGLNPHCFGMDYNRLAAVSQYREKSSAAKAANVTEDCGLLFRLHRGSKHSKGEHGLLTLWCLRGQGETLQQAVDDGMKSDMYQERLAEAGQPSVRLVNGRKVDFRTPVAIAA